MVRKLCEECKGELKRQTVDFKLFEISLGRYPAEVCQKCGEKVFAEDISDKIDAAAKKKGLWGLAATTKIGMSGTSLSLTINKKISEFMDLRLGEEVSIHPESRKRLVVEVSG